MTGLKTRDEDGATTEPAEGGLAMSAASQAVAPLMVADDASGLGQPIETLLASQTRFKLRFDRPLDLAEGPVGVFPPSRCGWSRPRTGS